MTKQVDLSVEFCGVKFKNPFLLSSSPVSNSAEMVGRSFDEGWAGVAYKTVVMDNEPIIHPSPRMQGVNYGNKQLVGLQNVEQTSDRGLRANLLDMAYLKKHWPDHILIAKTAGAMAEAHDGVIIVHGTDRLPRPRARASRAH